MGDGQITPDATAGVGRARLILVVEDNPANQLLAETVLVAANFKVDIAGNAAEALARVKLRRPDLILMDIQLPGQDGLSFTRQLKADQNTAAIPVVALTAHAMVDDRQRSLDAGCICYISKPFVTKMLAKQVDDFLAGG